MSSLGRHEIEARLKDILTSQLEVPAHIVRACDATSLGLPAALPSGKSLNRKRGTPTRSTMSLAQPMTTVGIPFASRWRATRLTVW